MKTVHIIAVLLIFISCGRFTDVERLEKTTMRFEHPNRKYTPILKGKVLKITYKYINTGEYPLVISEIQTSCNCTVTDYRKRAVGKGQTGYINVSFDSRKNTGKVKQYITVIANVNNTLSNSISFETNVVVKSKLVKDYEEVYYSENEIEEIEGEYVSE